MLTGNLPFKTKEKDIALAPQGVKQGRHSNTTTVKSGTSIRKPPVVIAVPATTSKIHSPSHKKSRRGFFKLFRAPADSNKSALKTSRGGLLIPPRQEERLSLPVRDRLPLSSSSSAVLLRRSHSTGSRTDFSGVVTSIETSTDNSPEVERSTSFIVQRRINSRLRRSFSSPTSSEAHDPEMASSSNSPQVVRRLLTEEDLNTDIWDQPSPSKEQRMGKIGSRSIGMSSQRQRVDEGLSAAAHSPQRQRDLIFVASSSSETDPSEANQNLPMQTRGISIPTPTMDRRSASANDSSHYYAYNEGGIFSRPLIRVNESPAVKTNLLHRLQLQERISSEALVGEVDDDDDAFLPDDFNKTATTYSEADLQKKIGEAKEAMIEEARREFEQKIKILEAKYDESLLEHGLEWRREKEAEQERLTARIVEEKSKTARQQQELLEQARIMEDLKSNIDEYERGKAATNNAMVAQELYKDQLEEKINDMQKELLDLHKEKRNIANLTTELQSLQVAKVSADRRIEELQYELNDANKLQSLNQDLNLRLTAARKEIDELREGRESDTEELVIVKRDQAIAKQQIDYLTEQLGSRTDSHNDVLSRLQESEGSNSSLQLELSQEIEAKKKSSEELRMAYDDIERLRSLRIQDEKEMEALRTQMSRVNDHYQAILFSPPKGGREVSPDSPCSQVDILRVDNDKVHEQLKAMGQILKRYKAERDDIKARMVHTVEVAVKQVKQNMQEALDVSSSDLQKALQELEQAEKRLSQKEEECEKQSVQLEELKARFETENNDLIQSNQVISKKYKSDMALLESKMREETEKRTKWELDYNQLQKQVESMQELHQEEVDLLHAEARQELKVRLEQDTRSIQTELHSMRVERDDLATRLANLETQLEEAHSISKKNRLDSDHRLHELESNHRKEIDELTAELDLFEAENADRMQKLQRSLQEKETVISAMGSQLAESESRITSTNQNCDLLQHKIENLQTELIKAKEDIKSKELALADQVFLKEKAIEDVANELTTRAEMQFEERNEMYRVLKKKFDEATSKISVLERDLRFAKKELDELQKRHEAKVADLKDELAQLKAALAKCDANLVRAEKNHRVELQKSKDELEAAKATSQQIQKSLAIVAKEKEQLQAEVLEMKNISEELMAIVEENGLG